MKKEKDLSGYCPFKGRWKREKWGVRKKSNVR
jgi:hypothetical protein